MREGVARVGCLDAMQLETVDLRVDRRLGEVGQHRCDIRKACRARILQRYLAIHDRHALDPHQADGAAIGPSADDLRPAPAAKREPDRSVLQPCLEAALEQHAAIVPAFQLREV